MLKKPSKPRSPVAKSSKPKARYSNTLQPTMSTAMEDPNAEDREPMEHEIKDAYDTLVKAEGIKGNEKMMTHVTNHANKHLKVVKSIKDLRSVYNNSKGRPENVLAEEESE